MPHSLPLRPAVVASALCVVLVGLCGFAGVATARPGLPAVTGHLAAITDQCTQYPHPAMPPSTGTQTPTGFTVQMAGAVLAPSSAASTLPSAYTQFNDMTCTKYSHHYQEAPPDYFYYDCVGFTGYTVRTSDPLAWQSVMQVVGLHSYGVVPTPLAFEGFFAGLQVTPQPAWTAVPSVQAVQPGDVLAWQPANPDGSPDTSGVGHSVMPLVAPQAIAGSNGKRWEVVVMDSTAGGHGPDDTRKPADPLSQRNAPILTSNQTVEPSGLGIGTIALDTTSGGQVTGVEWNVGDAPEPIVFGAGRPLAGSPPGPTPPFTTAGYDVVTANGPVTSFGDATGHGPSGPLALRAPIVGMTGTIDGSGYWLAAADGGVFAYGDAPFAGSLAGTTLRAPVVGIGNDPNGLGYWLAAADGGVFSFGDAGFSGSMGGRPLDAPVVGITPVPDGQGYWLVAADGGAFNFGSAGFSGSMGGRPLDAPVVSIASTNDGGGYWEFASDGGVFSFGDAPFLGSAATTPHAFPAVGAIED